ncbi:MAG: heavy metal translocating P-type ATPase [Oscillochloridaceae bacterium umkhey_bin13]
MSTNAVSVNQTTLEVQVCGMDCADCANHVQQALAGLPGVTQATVLLGAERAIIQGDPALVTLPAISAAVAAAGYSVPSSELASSRPSPAALGQRVLAVFGLVFGAVLLIVVAGEWLGLLDALTELVPFWLGVILVGLAGWPVFLNVARATMRRQIIAHSLMTLGVLAALAVGEWATAAVVVFFMRIGDFVEGFTADQARRAVRRLGELAPQTARLERDDGEIRVPISAVSPGEIVVVRPGEQIPVDGLVLSGEATVDQAAITGEPMPVEVGPGAHVYAATIARLGSLRVRTERVGASTTFGKVVRLVEEAEANRAEVQRLADRFATWFLPVVVVLAALTFIVRGDPLATAAVLVVACSCSFALATPVAVLAAVGSAARRGLLIKGGRTLELLARADVLLVDKTGTLTLGQPTISAVVPLGSYREDELLAFAAAAERYSEHPLAAAVREAAQARKLTLATPEGFRAIPGAGVRATVTGHQVAVGGPRLLPPTQEQEPPAAAEALRHHGYSLLYVIVDDVLVGLLGASDCERPEVAAALAEVRQLGINEIVMLTGDHAGAAAPLAERLGVSYQAGLLPEQKIAVVREYQARGHTVIMVGDGVNDAPALAQADVGVAMGVAGSDIALEAAHAALMRDDWTLLPELLRLGRRSMGVIRANLGMTVAYNMVGLTLAAMGFLPPMLAAAMQSLPDLGILGNSARLLKK